MVSERLSEDEPLDISTHLHDDLTGLPRRAIFDDRLRHARGRAERRSEVLGVVLLEFGAPEDFTDAFRSDESLRELLAERVTDPLRISDTVAVYRPTQLAILLEDVSSQIGAQLAISRIMEMGQMPTIVGGRHFVPIIKAGVAVSLPPHIPAEELMGQVESALERAYRRDGSNFVCHGGLF